MGHPIHVAMMKLEVDGEPTVFQALDQIVLPERAGVIERDRVQPRDQRPQLFRSCRGFGSAARWM